MNLVGAALIAVLLVGLSLDRRSPSPVETVSACLGGLVIVVWGARLMLARVLITPESVRYRGVVRSRSIPLGDVIGFAHGDTWLSLLLGDRPIIVSSNPDGSSSKTPLVCFYTSVRRGIGTSATERACDDLRLELEPYIRENLGR